MKPTLRLAALLLLLAATPNALFAQDNCASPTTLTVQTNSCSSTTAATTVGATQSTSPTPVASAYNDDDIFFKFTTPAGVTKITITISSVTGTVVGTGSQLYLEARDGNSGICGNYYFNNTTLPTTGGNWALTGLQASTDYSIRFYTGDNTSRASFNICAFVPPVPPPPSNDECATAATLTPVSGASCTGGIAYTTVGATTSVQASGDGAGKDDDIWFSFTTSSSPQAYKFSMGTVAYETSGSSVIELFGGCSPTGNYINWWPFATSANFGVLQPSTTYLVRVYTYGTTSRISSFSPCLSMLRVPVNDECSNAPVIPVNTDGTYSLSVNGTTVNTTQSTQTMAPCTITADDDVWFKFVAPSTGAVQLNIFNATETMFTSIYSGSSCATLTSRKCIYGAGDTLFGLAPNSIYYARIMTQNSGVSSTFTVAIRSIANPVTNTTCATAATLATTYQQGTTAGLTTNSSILACYGSAAPNKELWYSFTATATSHFLDFADMVKLSLNNNSLGFRVSSGTCASLTSIKCVDGVVQNNSSITGLTIGSTYYVQVLENTYNGGSVQYAVRLRTPQAPSNDEYNGGGVPTLVQEPTISYLPTTMRFSTLSANPPTGTFTQDIWYRFYAASASVNVGITDGLTIAAPRIALYNADGTTLNNAGTNSYSSSFGGLTVGSLYYLRVLNTAPITENGNADFKIAVYGIPSGIVADAAPAGSTCITADGPVTSTNAGRWLHITHQGKMLASILDNAGNAMGAMTAKYFTNSATVRSDASGIEYLDRNYEITPAVQPTNPVIVRLYFSKAEFDAMVNANDGDGNDVLWLSDLKVAKFSAVPCASTLNLSGEQLYNIKNWGALSTSAYFIDVQVPAFSSFFLKTVAGGLLPVTCSNFNYKAADGKVQLLWSTQTETNAKEFALQRSSDGVNFTTIATITASGNSNNLKNYQYSDAVRNNETVYYRLQQTDKDGKQQFICRTLKVNMVGKAQLFGNAYPNPAISMVTIDMLKPFIGKADVQIVNVLGQVLQHQSFYLQASDAQLRINTQSLKFGTYSVRIITSGGVQVQQITKM